MNREKLERIKALRSFEPGAQARGWNDCLDEVLHILDVPSEEIIGEYSKPKTPPQSA